VLDNGSAGAAPGIEQLVYDDLARAYTDAIDLALFDPANDGSGVEPASLTHGAPTIATTSDFAKDLAVLFALFEGNLTLKGAATRQELYVLVDQLLEKFADVDERLNTVEKSGARFRGVYQRASTYRRGDQATHKGSLWTALKDAPESTVPGENPSHWQLAAKGGG
jgi:hypothetical protein